MKRGPRKEVAPIVQYRLIARTGNKERKSWSKGGGVSGFVRADARAPRRKENSEKWRTSKKGERNAQKKKMWGGREKRQQTGETKRGHLSTLKKKKAEKQVKHWHYRAFTQYWSEKKKEQSSG